LDWGCWRWDWKQNLKKPKRGQLVFPQDDRKSTKKKKRRRKKKERAKNKRKGMVAGRKDSKTLKYAGIRGDFTCKVSKEKKIPRGGEKQTRSGMGERCWYR